MPKRSAAFVAQLSLPLLLLFALAAPGVPQNQEPANQTQRPRKVFPKEQEPEDVFRFDTDLVSVDVTAIDAEGRPIRNLRFTTSVLDALASVERIGREPLLIRSWLGGNLVPALRVGRFAFTGATQF